MTSDQGFIVSMSQLVSFQLISGGKCPGAARHVARIGLDFIVGHDMQLQLVTLAVRLLTVLHGTAPEFLPGGDLNPDNVVHLDAVLQQ